MFYQACRSHEFVEVALQRSITRNYDVYGRRLLERMYSDDTAPNLTVKAPHRTDRSTASKYRVRPDHRFAHPYEPIIEPLPAHALRRDARAFEQQEQFVR